MTKNYDKEKLHQLYLEIWKKRQILGRNYSAVSLQMLPKEPSSLFFDHLLDKHLYPELIYEERNIALVTAEEHEVKTKGFPLKRHKELIEKARKELL